MESGNMNEKCERCGHEIKGKICTVYGCALRKKQLELDRRSSGERKIKDKKQ